jgi:acetyl esterase/lipase
MNFFIPTFLLAPSLLLAAPTREPLYPNGTPGATGDGPEHTPALTWYPADAASNTRVAVVILPGGGYGTHAINHEGHQIAEWLNGLGISGVIVEYRMSKGGYHHPVPLQDAQRAVRTVRARAVEFGIDPAKIGIIGFSAGGHLASAVITHWDGGDPAAADPVERVNSRPDFAVLCYPVIAFGEPFSHPGSQDNLLGKDADPALLRADTTEKHVTPQTPPTFILQTDADTVVPAEHAVAFYLALRKARVPAELHIYQPGRHGLGLAKGVTGVEQWPAALRAWLVNMKILNP